MKGGIEAPKPGGDQFPPLPGEEAAQPLPPIGGGADGYLLAEHHPDRDRRMYCEGSAHGLRAASKMVEEALGAAASRKAGGR